MILFNNKKTIKKIMEDMVELYKVDKGDAVIWHDGKEFNAKALYDVFKEGDISDSVAAVKGTPYEVVFTCDCCGIINERRVVFPFRDIGESTPTPFLLCNNCLIKARRLLERK